MRLSVIAGLPVVPGAFVVADQVPGFFVAYGALVAEPGANPYLPFYAFIWEADPNLFAVFAEDSDFKTIDPGKTGEVMKDWQLVPGNLAKWPITPGWRAADSVSPVAQPTVPSSCGPDDLDTNLKNAVAVSP
jgi:hypothetical protein